MSDLSALPSSPVSGSRFKSRAGWQRLGRAWSCSWAGLAAAWRHEAALRQEVAVGAPLVALAWWVAATPLQAVALVAVVMLVWIVELLNSALEAVADSLTLEHHPLIGRAKDIASAAVMLSIVLAALTWGVVVLGRFG